MRNLSFLLSLLLLVPSYTFGSGFFGGGGGGGGGADTNALYRDGSQVPTANTPWNAKKITSLGDPSSAQDAATKAYVDANAGGADSNAIYRNNSQPPTADISMGSHKLTSVTDPTNAQDAATKAYADGLVTNTAIQAKTLSSFSAAAGTVTSADSIVSAFNKIAANILLRALAANPVFTGTFTGPWTAGVLKSSSGGVVTSSAVGVSDISATGTASSSTYLRGDGTWTAPPTINTGSVTAGVAVVANGSGGTNVTEDTLRLPAHDNVFLAGNGTKAELSLGTMKVYYNPPWFAVTPLDYGTSGQLLQILNGGAQGLNDAYLFGALYNRYSSIQYAGTGFTSDVSQVAAGANKTIWAYPVDRGDATLQVFITCLVGDANNESAIFNRWFQFQGNGSTAYTELNSNNGKAMPSDTITSGMTGTTLTSSITGLTISVILHNGSSAAARQTCQVWDFNGHNNAS